MSLQHLGILLLAAWLHASWNFRLKRCSQSTLVFWWALAGSSLLLLPVLWVVGLPSAAACPWLFSSALLQAIYLWLLSRAYQVAEFSLVYPMARGAAPLFLLFYSRVLLQHPLSWVGQLGVLILTLGLIGLGYTSERKGLGLALLIAALIAGYTCLDSVGVKLTSPWSYLALQWCLSCLMAFPAMARSNLDVRVLAESWKDVVYIGLASASAYGLALWIYQTAPVAYAGAVREVSVVMAAWMSWRWGGESFTWRRWLACLAIVAGIGLLAAA